MLGLPPLHLPLPSARHRPFLFPRPAPADCPPPDIRLLCRRCFVSVLPLAWFLSQTSPKETFFKPFAHQPRSALSLRARTGERCQLRLLQHRHLPAGHGPLACVPGRPAPPLRGLRCESLSLPCKNGALTCVPPFVSVGRGAGRHARALAGGHRQLTGTGCSGSRGEGGVQQLLDQIVR